MDKTHPDSRLKVGEVVFEPTEQILITKIGREDKSDFISLNNTRGLKFRELISSSLAEPLRFRTMYLQQYM